MNGVGKGIYVGKTFLILFCHKRNKTFITL
jgi:hypothetical protein